jgi:ubiquinone/menaquinone biosynthesis C-methylase UbiE
MEKKIVIYLLAVPALFTVWMLFVQVVRYFYKFPMPQFMADLIDNPLRRRIQPPEEMPSRHQIKPGMQVLEVGPGNGTYTLATAHHLTRSGRLVAIDIEPRMIQRVKSKIQNAGIEYVDVRVADVNDLPFEDQVFDLVYMITVIGEIPNRPKALQEIRRVLKPQGKLAFSELLFDPDYPQAGNLILDVSAAGFRFLSKAGNLLDYTLIFEKSEE